MTKISKDNQGFTLIELIVVLIIVATLATLGVQQYQNMVWKARFAEVYQNVGMIVKAEKMYYMMNGHYTINAWDQTYLGKGTPAGSTNIQKQLGISFPENSLFIYIVYPRDDLPTNTYIYFKESMYCDWCWRYDYVAETWFDCTVANPGPGCKYFVPPRG